MQLSATRFVLAREAARVLQAHPERSPSPPCSERGFTGRHIRLGLPMRPSTCLPVVLQPSNFVEPSLRYAMQRTAFLHRLSSRCMHGSHSIGVYATSAASPCEEPDPALHAGT